MQPVAAFETPAKKMELLELPCVPDDPEEDHKDRPSVRSSKRQRSSVAVMPGSDDDSEDSSTFLLLLGHDKGCRMLVDDLYELN